MRIIHNLQQANIENETALTIGAFDGLHLGHQELLRQLIRRAQQTQRLSGVVTFDPLPKAVLSPASNLICLTTIEDKIELLEQWGLDLLVILPFTAELARTSARDFVQGLCTHLRMTELWVGWNFALGYGREGNVRMLKKLGKEMGFRVHVIAPVTNGEIAISSTQIRHLLSAGQVSEAAEMLGRYYQVRAYAVSATEHDRQLGLSSVRLRFVPHCALPASGIYAAYALIQGQRYPAIVDTGFAVATEGRESNGRIYILDFHGNLGDEEIRVQFVEQLRQQPYPVDLHMRPSQIAKDIAKAREVL
ncbi:MAG: bifunctional riboflavin kinase/FMN adenylyltransferase, partial [Chloroflexi bacterium]|nr:bifunctional riboflavin kinase/FMN adenylyltransferase [Chloroflexota bacterium]